MRPLKKYEIAINEASYDVCSKDASLLLNRQLLLENAPKYVDESGYAYANKSSCSNVFGNKEKKVKKKISFNGDQETQNSHSNGQIINAEDTVSMSCEDTVSLLEKQRVQYVNANKFLQAAEINTMISEKREAKAKLQEELARLGVAIAQAARHQKRKAAKLSP